MAYVKAGNAHLAISATATFAASAAIIAMGSGESIVNATVRFSGDTTAVPLQLRAGYVYEFSIVQLTACTGGRVYALATS